MENEPQQNFGLKSSTSVTILLPSAESTAHPQEQPEPIVSDSTMKHLLENERDSCVIQLENMKNAAESFKGVIAEKEKTLNNLKVGNTLLKQSLRPMGVKIEETKKATGDKRAIELDLLNKKVAESEESEKMFNEAVADYKKKMEGKSASLAAHRKSMAEECEALQRLYTNEVENTKASLKELNKVHKQALADHAKLTDEKKFQLEKVELLKQECQQMYSQFENIGAERKVLNKQLNDVDARLIEVEQLTKMERESPALLKIEDNKRNMALRNKQISDASMQQKQKKQALSMQNNKLSGSVKERDLLTEERKAMEKTFQAKLDELNKISAEMDNKNTELENTKKRTEELETETKKNLAELRRKSESISAKLMQELEGMRRESVHFAHQAEEQKKTEKQKEEQKKEELRQELVSLDETLEALKQSHKIELETKQRYYERVEQDLEVFGKGEKEGNEGEIDLITSKIEKMGVNRRTAEAEFEEQQAEMKKEIETVKRKLVIAKKAVESGKVIEENTSRAEQAREAVRALEREINAKKVKYFGMHKESYDLKNDSTQSGMQNESAMLSQSGANSQIVQSPNDQIALRQAKRGMPQLEGPVTKWHEQRPNGEVLEQVSVAGAAGKFTTQTLSKVGTSSNPANYQIETLQMETTLPGFDANSDFTTKIRKVVYSGKGIDKHVLDEAKRILVIHQNGVTREADETEEDFKMRQMLVQRADELQKMAQHLDLSENSMPNSAAPALKPNEKSPVEEISNLQAVFAQITQRLARSQHSMVNVLSETLTQIETALLQDSEKISKMSSGL